MVRTLEVDITVAKANIAWNKDPGKKKKLILFLRIFKNIKYILQE